MAKKKEPMRWTVTAEYGCTVETTVEAETEDEAKRIASPELDELASRNLSCRSEKAREIM